MEIKFDLALAEADRRNRGSVSKSDDTSDLVRNYTRGTYAWRQRHFGTTKLVPAAPNQDPLDMISPEWEVIPKFIYKSEDQYVLEIWRRDKLISTLYGFTKACKNAECKRTTCALCYFHHTMAPIKDRVTIVKIKMIEGKVVEVRDPSGVHPKGLKSGPQKGPDVDTKALWAISSTQRSPKTGSSNRWRKIKK